MSGYSLLFGIDVEHAYWTQAQTAFDWVPTRQTAEWMLRRDLLLRPHRAGIAVFCEQARRGLLLDGLKEGELQLAFRLFPKDALFSQYSWPPPGRPQELPYLHSARARREQDGRYCLHQGARLESGEFTELSDPVLAMHLEARDQLRKPALVIAVDLATQVAGQDDGVMYYLRYGTRRSVWKYFIVSDEQAEGMSVVDLDGELNFVAGEPEMLPGDRRALVFMSQDEIDMRQRHGQRLQLRQRGELGERVLVARLPNADAGKVARQEASGGATGGDAVDSNAVLVSEIYVT